MARRLRFTIDGVGYHAILQNHALADSLSGMCPFTAEYTRSGEHEYYAALPKKAAVNACPSTTKGHRNGLYYFEGWNAISLVFKDCDTAPFEIHHVGDFEEDASAVLKMADDHLHIICELEEGD